MFFFLLLMGTRSIYACEPASVNWENVYQQVKPNIQNLDQAKNIFLSFDDFKKISNIYPYE
ncbi:hypothetical protein B9T33_10005 [Acinetobacter sp. ANC 5054]|nr:hypothetical protein B9T33_10005 [Acinetobacter sp. ANC 5054]